MIFHKCHLLERVQLLLFFSPNFLIVKIQVHRNVKQKKLKTSFLKDKVKKLEHLIFFKYPIPPKFIQYDEKVLDNKK